MKFTHEGVEYEVAALAAWLRRCSTDAKYEQADEHADKLSAAAALLARHERVCEALQKCAAILSGEGLSKSELIDALEHARAALRGEEAPRG